MNVTMRENNLKTQTNLTNTHTHYTYQLSTLTNDADAQ